MTLKRFVFAAIVGLIFGLVVLLSISAVGVSVFNYVEDDGGKIDACLQHDINRNIEPQKMQMLLEKEAVFQREASFVIVQDMFRTCGSFIIGSSILITVTLSFLTSSKRIKHTDA